MYKQTKTPTIEKMIVKNKMVKLIKSELSKNGFKFNSNTMEGKNKEFGETISFTFNSKGKISKGKYDNGWYSFEGKISDMDVLTIALKEMIEISKEHRNNCK
jgi:hypothetical protein